jgi:hypothetical protein
LYRGLPIHRAPSSASPCGAGYRSCGSRWPALAAQGTDLAGLDGIDHIIGGVEVNDAARLDEQDLLAFGLVGVEADVFTQAEHLLLHEDHKLFLRVVEAQLAGEGENLALEQITVILEGGIHISLL